MNRVVPFIHYLSPLKKFVKSQALIYFPFTINMSVIYIFNFNLHLKTFIPFSKTPYFSPLNYTKMPEQ